MSKKRYYKFLDDKQEWVIRDRTNREQEYRVGRNKRYAEKLVDLFNSFAKENEKLTKENNKLKETCNRFEEAIEKRGYEDIDDFW